MKVNAVLDAKGLLCPEPVMMLHVEMRKLKGGEMLKVLATDPSTTRDIPKFCQFLGHTLEKSEQDDDLYTYWIIKKQK
ncbi:sulfurtransferase TusA [Marinomonas sp. 2405UD68-3]|uniref:sulfurtransferase TusA n=1 Tax=Marinomonas sp. 2405UD68-3 TaxID=3391835 RepID=UPI0039C95089